ncbi:response regulator [Anaeromyxobacter paludicola]|uniref:Response regulatory domain-containing protein n=1 Tax=Anaeromyxobacter paludicola TaxID=2918171 RepID=A0ABN6N476_9BACT|nr:response regulator [Anaeromyxobacter paludicola]BDG07988.1 hypothetical protein AMPC_11010 [Anaeromyxobacter paludicola]
MATILTVDDSRAVRTIVAKQVRELGFDVGEAEDGVQGLARLQEARFDLVLLDVTMPNMDGPTMLQTLRERGDKTPVIMLTSESKRSVVASALKQGITDYILKPFKPEELRSKILSVLQAAAPADALAAMNAAVGAPAGAAPAAPAAAAPSAAQPAAGAKGAMDLLVIDDMENVAKRLRQLLPQQLSLHGAVNAAQALQACREASFKVVLLDTEIPDVNSVVLMGQLRVLQPNAAFVALALRTTNDVVKEVKQQGFDDVFYKPFKPENIDDLVAQYFESSSDALSIQDNVVSMASFSGKPERLEKFYGRLTTMLPEALNQLANACYADMIFQVGQVPSDGDRLPRLVMGLVTQASSMGIEVSLVGSDEARKTLSGFDETKSLKFYPTLEEARAASGS